MTPLNNSDNLDEFFRDKLKNYRTEPPKKTWGKINDQLNATNRAPWTSYAEGFVLICIIAGLMFGLYSYTPYLLNDSSASKDLLSHFSALGEGPFADVKQKKNIEKVKQKKQTQKSKLHANSTKQSPAHTSLNTPPTKNIEADSKPNIETPSDPSLSHLSEPNNEATGVDGLSEQKEKKGDKKIKSNPVLKEEQTKVDSDEISANLLIEKTPELLSTMEGLKELSLLNNSKENSRPWEFAFQKNPIPGYSQQEARKPAKNIFYAGINYTLNNTWIFNQNTYGEFNNSELNYKVDFGSAYTFLGGFERNEKFGVQLECKLYSLQGQKYEDNLYNGHVKREVNLHYSSFPLIFKWINTVSQTDKSKVRFNVLLGIQYDRLKDATIQVNEEKVNAMDKFKPYDVAGVLGAETNVYVFDNIYITLGVRGSVSSNINDKDYPVQRERSGFLGSYDKSHNILFGVNGGLHYAFGR